MINEYYEYKYFMETILLSKRETSVTVLNRMIEVLAQRFVFPKRDEESGTFLNDFYDSRKQKDRLKYSKRAIKTLLYGELDNLAQESTLFINYFTNDLKEFKNSEEFIEKLKNNEIKKLIVDKKEVEVTDKRIEYANLNAVIVGPLKTNIALKYRIDQIKDLIQYSSTAQVSDMKKIQLGVPMLSIMLMSYYFYNKNNSILNRVKLIAKTMKGIYTNTSNFFDQNIRIRSNGFKSLNLVNIEPEDTPEYAGLYLSDTEITSKYKPESIGFSNCEDVFYEEGKYFIYVDKGPYTWSILKEKLPNFCEKYNITKIK